MSHVQFLYAAAAASNVAPPTIPDSAAVPDAECWLCGGETGGVGRLRASVLKPTFTDYAFAKRPASQSVCPACCWALSEPRLRTHSLLATEAGLEFPDRVRIRDFLVTPPPGRWLLCAAVSGQKHLWIKARVNEGPVRVAGRDGYWVRFEDVDLHVPPGTLAGLLNLVEPLLALGFGGREILSGQYSLERIRRAGIPAWQEFEKPLGPWRGRPLLDFAVWCARGPAREDAGEVQGSRAAAGTGGGG